MDRRGLHLHGLPAGRSFQTDKQPEKISGHETSLITTLGPFYHTPALDNRHPACRQNNRRQPGEPLNASDTTIAISSLLLFLRTSPRKKSVIDQVLFLLSDKHNYIRSYIFGFYSLLLLHASAEAQVRGRWRHLLEEAKVHPGLQSR